MFATIEHYLPTLYFFQTIATVCIFLGSKIEDTPCQLKHVVIVSYETMYHKNPDAAKRIHQEVSNYAHLLHYYHSLTVFDLFTKQVLFSLKSMKCLRSKRH